MLMSTYSVLNIQKQLFLTEYVLVNFGDNSGTGTIATEGLHNRLYNEYIFGYK